MTKRMIKEPEPNMERIAMLKEGMEFKNMIALCNFLEIERPNSTGFQALRIEFALYKLGWSMERDGHTIILHEVK